MGQYSAAVTVDCSSDSQSCCNSVAAVDRHFDNRSSYYCSHIHSSSSSSAVVGGRLHSDQNTGVDKHLHNIAH